MFRPWRSPRRSCTSFLGVSGARTVGLETETIFHTGPSAANADDSRGARATPASVIRKLLPAQRAAHHHLLLLRSLAPMRLAPFARPPASSHALRLRLAPFPGPLRFASFCARAVSWARTLLFTGAGEQVPRAGERRARGLPQQRWHTRRTLADIALARHRRRRRIITRPRHPRVIHIIRFIHIARHQTGDVVKNTSPPLALESSTYESSLLLPEEIK